jgi:hypothetical protein
MLTSAVKLIQVFDMKGEPVAPLNMVGQSVYKTTFGGLVRILVTGIILCFTIKRYDPKLS